MYSLEQLEQKNIKQLKEIGWQLNLLPAADRRCRQNWIDAIVGVNPPLLQLLEFSPAVSVEQVQEPIAPAATIFSTNDRVCVHSGLFSGMTGRVMRGSTSYTIRVEFDRRYEPSGAYFAFIGRDCLTLLEPVVDELTVSAIEVQVRERKEVSPGVEVEQVQEAIAQAAEIPPGVDPGVDVDRVQKPIAPAVETSPGVEVDPVEESIVLAKNFPGSRSKTSTAHQLLELFQSRVHIIEDSPGVKTEATASESAIAPAAKNRILTGITFSDRFLARYSPPQLEIIHFQSDAGGQLSLLNFEIESASEPPDPDDFESLDAFREALARWDFEHPEELAVSLDSMCEWAPCPADWYEFDTELELSQVSELSPGRKSSITSDFFILTFDRLSDRPHRSDEPPDTGIYARLPKPKPPSFPPGTVGQAQPKPQPTVTQPQAKRIPNAYQTHTCCIVAGSSTQPARSPPFGDAGF